MKNNKRFLGYYRQVTCKVFVLGHPTQGESIIFVLYGDEQVLYSCVIDSFMIGDRIIPGEYLNKLKLKKITELFWTHPHDDHSAGILQLVDTFSPDSVYLPVELLSLPEENESIAKEVLQQLNSYKCYDGRIKRYQPKIKEVAANMLLHNESIWAENYFIPFEMLAIAPCSGKVRKNVLGENYATLNDYSIVLDVNVGDFSILLTGDVQNRMIQFLPEELSFDVPTPNILKIPHHGSSGSLSIMEIFEDDFPISASITTAKRSSGLPRDDAMRCYASRSRKTFKIDTDTTECAIWGVEVNILNHSITQIAQENYYEFSS